MPRPAQRRPAKARPKHSTKPSPARKAASELDQLLDEAMARPAPAATSFAEMGLPPLLVTALARRGISTPFAIQTRALPDGLAGRDVLGRAQTGAGKTLAFGLPMLARLAGSRSRPRRPRGLVLVPTRELAMQVTDALRPLADVVGVRTTAVFGGSPYGRQLAALERGVDIVRRHGPATTPGDRTCETWDRRSIRDPVPRLAGRTRRT